MKETITSWPGSLSRERTLADVMVTGLYLICLVLIWVLPGSREPDLFTGGDIGPVSILYYGGIYLLTAVLFGCSTAILFTSVKGKTGQGMRVYTLTTLGIAFFLLYLVLAGLTGSMQMELPFYLPGWDYFGVSPLIDAGLSLVVFFPAIGLLSLAVVVPFLLIDRYFPMKRSFALLLVSGTILFPCLMTFLIPGFPVPSFIPWLSLLLSTISVFCLGVIGTVILCTPPVVLLVLKRRGAGLQSRQTRLIGLFILCILLVWFIPGFIEPGLFISNHDQSDDWQKSHWFVPDGTWDSEYPSSTVHTIDGDYLIDEDRFTIRHSPSSTPLTIAHAVYTKQNSGEQYIVTQWWYDDEQVFRDAKEVAFQSLSGLGAVSEVTLDIGDYLLAAGFERSEAKKRYPAWRFENESSIAYILTYERPFDEGRSNDFYIVYYGTYGEARSSDPDRALKALLAQRFSPSGVRAPWEEYDEEAESSRMPNAELFLYISKMIRFAGVLILTPLLFGCSTALLFTGVKIKLQSQPRRVAFIVPLLAVALVLLPLIPVFLMGSISIYPPFYIPGWEHFGIPPHLDALLSLAVFLPAISLLAIGVIAPFFLLRRYLPPERPVHAVLVSGTILFPFLMILSVWESPDLPFVPWFSLLILSLQKLFLAAAGAAAVCVLWAAVERTMARLR